MNAAREPAYVHANALVVGAQGLLLRGPSGAGKSALTLALISHVVARGDFASLVGDDRVAIEARNGRLIARPHPAIPGLIEMRGLGLSRMRHEPACVLHAVLDLCPPGGMPKRHPDDAEKCVELQGVVLPRLCVDCASVSAIPTIMAFLHGLASF